MRDPQEIRQVEKCDLVGMVAELFSEGFRLVQIGCSTLAGGYELTYSFDREYRLKNLRFLVRPQEEVPSISVIYPGAFLYENEIHDLFGVVIEHIAVDYRGTLYRTALGRPFSLENVKLPQPPQPKAQPESKVGAEVEAKPEAETAASAGEHPVGQDR
ncbi:MAG TPA: NADH-quinone oxidoreductase subunit C [Geomonas sp.]|nr:NADH-quinone oxidoreductase subunit C [Geomonas sp.]